MATHKLSPAKLQAAEHYRTRYAAVVDDGTTVEDLQRPEFWCHVAGRMRQMDVIEVLSEDGSYFAELLVLKTGVGFAKVMLLRKVDLETPAADDDASLVQVQWKGPHRKHAVIRKSDGEILKDSFATKVDAETFARDYERTVTA
ncbi:hypothetical protein BSL82_09530 [Tardibacter chloracetimidivorans]|uniref:Uncharacterized protein n=1 Tax=Tardibacter chloracetimidivorans TaxID=1921510 RepID=A0A1L3ZV54_9SPHN|nr:hypothetical protein [Tardibacter chloracetimidivorans]API59521.1 hypothetical protein BSL82_09530 [Tardibacter chloracetimidivorans]